MKKSNEVVDTIISAIKRLENLSGKGLDEIKKELRTDSEHLIYYNNLPS